MKTNNLFKIFLSFLIPILWTDVNCQNDESHQSFSTVICEYNLPINRDGLSVTAFNVTPRIRIERWEKNAMIILNIKKEQGTASNPNPSFKHSYNYLGKQYGNQNVGYEPFESIRADNVTFEVLVTYGSRAWGWTKVDGMDNQFGPIDKNAKASEVYVRVRIVNMGFNGTSKIENTIREQLQSLADKKNATEKQKKEQELARVQKIETDKKNTKIEHPTKNTNDPNDSTSKLITSDKVKNSSLSTNTKSQEGNSILSDKVIINDGQSVQVFKQGGKKYIRHADGKINETTQEAYDVIERRASTNASKKTEQETKLKAARELQVAKNMAAEVEFLAQQSRRQAKIELTTQVVSGALSLLNEWGEDKRQKEAYEAQQKEERDRIAAKARYEREQKIEQQNNFITLLEDTPLPLSSSNVEQDVIYYFASSVDKSSLATTKPIISLTDVFAIEKYNDGTWPYTATVKKDISLIMKSSSIVLNGYYTTKDEAAEAYKLVKDNLGELDFKILPFIYKGKIKETDTDSDCNNLTQNAISKDDTDFWGNSSKKEIKSDNTELRTKEAKPNPTKKEPVKGEVDKFWD